MCFLFCFSKFTEIFFRLFFSLLKWWKKSFPLLGCQIRMMKNFFFVRVSFVVEENNGSKFKVIDSRFFGIFFSFSISQSYHIIDLFADQNHQIDNQNHCVFECWNVNQMSFLNRFSILLAWLVLYDIRNKRIFFLFRNKEIAYDLFFICIFVLWMNLDCFCRETFHIWMFFLCLFACLYSMFVHWHHHLRFSLKFFFSKFCLFFVEKFHWKKRND